VRQPHHRAFESAHDVFGTRRLPLDVFVRPQSVAIIGATEKEGSVGRTLVANLLGSPISCKVFLINPTRATVLGHNCYKRLAEVPEPVELALIAVPAPTVPGVIKECLAAGIRGAIVISAGFKEIGPAGIELEDQIRALIAGTDLRVIGPNCVGVMSPRTGLNATFAAALARPGNLGFISQSGAILTAILDWSATENVGFSHVISVGSMLDVGWGDLIDFLGDDPDTTSILMYMESIGNAKAFLSAAREVGLRKPIIVIKSGRTEKAAKAAASHTGALAGSDDVLTAAFRRVGVVQVRRVGELFNLAEALAKQPRPKGPNLAIVTNAGGPAVLALDALVEAGGQTATLSADTLRALSELLPPHWSHANPVDVLGDAPPQRIAKAAEIVGAAPETDGLLAILAPQAIADPTLTADLVAKRTNFPGKPILANWMGGKQMSEGVRVLNESGIPTYAYPDSAARTFQYMWQYSDALRALYETPALNNLEHGGDAQQAARRLLEGALASGRTLLTEPESKQLLAAYDIPTVQTLTARSAEEAVHAARTIGFPVVVKLLSKTITHKTDVGGVKLNLQSDSAVADAFNQIAAAVERTAGPGHFDGVTVQSMVRLDGYELILGSKIDPQFGPVILFGTGGQLVEVFQDRALALPPLTTTLARRMMERTKIFRALQGVRGRKPVDLVGLEQLLVRFAQLVAEQPRISEVDINPLLASSERLVALDARVVLHSSEISDGQLPRLVIRPYPRQYARDWIAKNGRRFLIRPIRPEDENLMARFHTMLSEESVYARYAQALSLRQRTAHDRLARLCFVDYDRQIALVAIDQQPDPRIVAVARLIKLHGSRDAEFAVTVADAYQHIGLGSEMMSRLAAIGRDEGLKHFVGQISATNAPMLSICRHLGFRFEDATDPHSTTAILDLQSAG
jgi:acetyltransferase